MGLVVKDDGWRIPDRVWVLMEPLLPARPWHPLGCHNPRVPDRDAMNAILLVLRRGDAVERAQRNRDLQLLVGVSSLSRVGRRRRVPRVLATGAARLRPKARDRVGVAGDGRRDGQGAAGRRRHRPESHRQR